MKNRISFVVIYMGKIPSYFSLFIESAIRNPTFDFIFFMDSELQSINANNIFINKISLKDLNQIAIEKGILKYEVKNGYKLCDLKPAWFDILEEYLPETQYEYVGYIDIDMILGNLTKFIDLNDIRNYDIWTIVDNYISGALTLFRNNEEIRKLYRKSPSWKIIFNDSRNFAFDEDLKQIFRNEFKSFSDLVKIEEKEGKIKVKWNHAVAFQNRPSFLTYSKLSIKDKEEKEYICFHYSVAKQYIAWTTPNWKIIPEKFYINKYGFFEKKECPLSLFTIIYSSYYKQLLIKIIKKKERIFFHIINTKWKFLYRLFIDQF